MKVIAIETVFIFILSLIAAIVFLMFFSNVKNVIINLFKEKQPKEDFEIEIIKKERFSQNFLLELSFLCVEKANKSKLKIENFTCYYLFSENSFNNIIHDEEIKIDNIKISFAFFNKDEKNVLVIYNRKKRTVYFIN